MCAIRRGSLWKKDIGQILKKLLKKSMMICMKSWKILTNEDVPVPLPDGCGSGCGWG